MARNAKDRRWKRSAASTRLECRSERAAPIRRDERSAHNGAESHVANEIIESRRGGVGQHQLPASGSHSATLPFNLRRLIFGCRAPSKNVRQRQRSAYRRQRKSRRKRQK